MDDEKFWLLLSVKLSGEATPEELDTLEQMLHENPALRLHAQMITQMWKKNETAEDPTAEDFFDKHLQRLSNHPDVYPTPIIPIEPGTSFEQEDPLKMKLYHWWRPLVAVAACAAVILVFWYNRNQKPISRSSDHSAQNTVSTRKGSKSNIQLPDGTLVWLNADSKVTYDENFRGEFREVNLEGEAFFDVVKDKTRPFIIHTKTIDIRVLGTAFNVRAYETEKNTETALFRGSVEVTLHNNPEKRIVLKPNEKLMVNNKSLAFEQDAGNDKNRANAEVSMAVGKVHFQKKDSAALETMWIKNKLVFDEEKLEEVARKIERWYDVTVVISGGDDLKYTAYSAIFDNENLEQVMEALKMTGNFRYSINKNTVSIH
ncbi:MAG: FecR family protein [Agriterribacter sp.]